MIIKINFSGDFSFRWAEEDLENLDNETIIVPNNYISIKYNYGIQETIIINYGTENNGFTKRDLAEIIWKEYQNFQQKKMLMDDLYYDINNLFIENIFIEINKNGSKNFTIVPQIAHYKE